MIHRVTLMLVITFGALSSAASAQTIEVRSGEHDGFSRLVVEFAERRNWRVKQHPKGYALVTNVLNEKYDISNVFKFIPRNRLGGIYQDKVTGNLILETNCACRVKSFTVRDYAVVIDISDGAPPIQNESVEKGEPEGSLIDALFESPVVLLKGTLDQDTDRPPEVTEEANVRSASKPGALPILPTPNPYPAQGIIGDELTRNLARGLARAAAQGLVDAREVQGLPVDGAGSPSSNVRIDTAVDRAFGVPEDLAVSPVQSGICRPASAFAIERWGDLSPAGEQIARHRVHLVSEFDETDTLAVMSLARLYIYLSFGAEARSLVEAFDVKSDDVDLILALADIVDDRAGPHEEIASQIECGGKNSLWAALSLGRIESDVRFDTDSVTLAYFELPPHLRRQFGPKLARILVTIGEEDAAIAVGNSVERAGPEDHPQLALTRGQESDLTAIQLEQLADVSKSGHPTEAQALILTLERMLAGNQRVPEDLIENAVIISFERSGSEDATTLKALEIRARLANVDTVGAFKALLPAVEAGTFPGAQRDLLADMALRHLVDQSDDSTFFAHVLDPQLSILLEHAGDHRVQGIAKRLLDLGFPDEAERFVSLNKGAESVEESEYAARLALRVGDVAKALRLTTSAETPDMKLLRAQALSRAGRHQEAAILLRDLELNEESLAESWRGTDWRVIADSDEEGLSLLAAEMLASLETPEESTDRVYSLADTQKQLSSSVELRQALDALLNDSEEMTE